MIQIKDKSKCSACKACFNICPQGAITFLYDDDGFDYPFIDVNKCSNCNLCNIVCPFIDDLHGIINCLENKPSYYAAQLKEKELLKTVSSGGAFQALGMAIISINGVVYGAVQHGVDQIKHERCTTPEELAMTRRSKYLQSDIDNSYKWVKKDLIDGKTVLFSGTGCQVAGLNCFLQKKDFDNLYTCEVVCHGVPSKRIWELYRSEKEEREGRQIIDIVFRDKSKGWSKNQYRITYNDGFVEYERSVSQLFHAGYLQGLFYRPSCGTCPFSSIPRVADITLADFWKYKGKLNKRDMGVSLVAVNTQKGMEL